MPAPIHSSTILFAANCSRAVANRAPAVKITGITLMIIPFLRIFSNLVLQGNGFAVFVDQLPQPRPCVNQRLMRNGDCHSVDLARQL